MTARLFNLARSVGAVLVAAGALAASGAQGQAIGNSNQPIDITANGLELIDEQRVQVWTGAVEAVQGTNRLRTRLLKVFHAPKPGAGDRIGQWGEAVRMVAEGDVYFLTPESVAKGDVGVYDLNRDTVTMTGDVILTRGESVLRGDKLVINTVTGLATLDAIAQGRGKKRVRGVFYPEEQAAPAAARPRASTARPARPAAAPSATEERQARGAGTGRSRTATTSESDAPTTPSTRDR